MRFTRLVLTVTVLAALGLRAAPADFFNETPQQRDTRMTWWRDARFGMFIHWGLYAVPAGEWKGQEIKGIGEWIMNRASIPLADYRPLVQQFNPVKYDADLWVRTAKDAGMTYIVITSKHHDGFCLWDSPSTEYDIMSTPYGKDLLRPLADACKKYGVTLCFYHSIMDWQHPNYGLLPKWDANRPGHQPDMDAYTAYLKGQLAELVKSYGPVGVMWFDGEWEAPWTHERGRDLYAYVRGLQPSILVNNRVDKGRQGMKGLTKEGDFAGDFGTPEQEIPPEGLPGLDWESCMTMNDTWGFKKSDHNWKSSRTLIRNLVDIASKGGNFLLNIGPTAEGEFPAASVERLAAMGNWMKVNGESIYGTDASPLGKVPFGRVTAKPGKLYLHVFDWPADGSVTVSLAALMDSPPVKKACLLADPAQALDVKANDDNSVTITVPKTPPDADVSVIALDFGGAFRPGRFGR
jgi:alpha-L-fucosidase